LSILDFLSAVLLLEMTSDLEKWSFIKIFGSDHFR